MFACVRVCMCTCMRACVHGRMHAYVHAHWRTGAHACMGHGRMRAWAHYMCMHAHVAIEFVVTETHGLVLVLCHLCFLQLHVSVHAGACVRAYMRACVRACVCARFAHAENSVL